MKIEFELIKYNTFYFKPEKKFNLCDYCVHAGQNSSKSGYLGDCPITTRIQGFPSCFQSFAGDKIKKL